MVSAESFLPSHCALLPVASAPTPAAMTTAAKGNAHGVADDEDDDCDAPAIELMARVAWAAAAAWSFLLAPTSRTTRGIFILTRK